VKNLPISDYNAVRDKHFTAGIIFIGGFPPSIARLAEYNYEVIRILARRVAAYGVNFIVLSNIPDVTAKSADVPSNVLVLYTWYKATTLLIPLRLMLLRKTCNTLILSFYHGVFGSSGITNFLSTLSILVTAKLLNYKVITILHTLPELREVFRFFVKKISSIYRLGTFLLTLLILTLSSKVILLVKAYKRILCDIFPRFRCKIEYIPHGVPIYIHYGSKRVDGKKMLTFAFVGLISSRKNFVVFKALNKIQSLMDIKRIKLVIIGAPHPYQFQEALSLLNKFINSNIYVEYVGYLETKALQEYIHRYVDVVILPYECPTGTSGIANIIAPSATPIVMPSFIEFRELFEDGHGLKLYDINNEDLEQSFVKAIYDVLTHPKEYEVLSRRALSFAQSNDIAKISSELLRIIFSSK